MKPGDRIRVTGQHHPWKGAVGEISRKYPGRALDWYLTLDPPHGNPLYGRESAARKADLEPEDQPAANVLFSPAHGDHLIMKITPELRKFLGFDAAGHWEPPAGMDPEVISLCRAMNAFPGIVTTESCCGHGKEPFRIWFLAESVEALPSLLWCFDACHSGLRGWSVRVVTDCVADHATFIAEGPCGGYAAAESEAKFMRETLASATTEEAAESPPQPGPVKVADDLFDAAFEWRPGGTSRG